MRRVVSFFSVLAFGLLIAGVLAVALTGSDLGQPGALGLPGRGAGEIAGTATGGSTGGFGLDHISLLIGMAAGWALATMGRIPWLELPQRTIAWLFKNERNIFRFGMAGLFLAVLVFY